VVGRIGSVLGSWIAGEGGTGLALFFFVFRSWFDWVCWVVIYSQDCAVLYECLWSSLPVL